MRVCRRCGVYAPSNTRVCDGCSGDLHDHVGEFPQGPYRCAAVRILRTCDGCGRKVPVDGLPESESVECLRCGRVEVVSQEEWSKVLGRIHAAADLVGADPEGFERSPVAIDLVNRFAIRAHQSAGVVFAADEADAFSGWLPDAWRVWAAPGLPLAPETTEPLELAAENGTLTVVGPSTTTSGARSGKRYALDPKWTARHSALVGTIGTESQVDRDPEVGVDAAGHWFCPTCQAPMSPRTTSRARCQECRAIAWIPARVRQAAAGPDPRPDTWWILFDGASSHRRYLERDPSTWSERHPDDRPLARMGPVAATPLRTAGRIAYLLVVPAIFLAAAALLWRWPEVGAWFGF